MKPFFNLTDAFIKHCLFLIVMSASFQLSAQEHLDDEISENRDRTFRHSINLEAGGRTLIMGSLNYEFLLYDRFALGVGIGFNSIARGEIIRNNNGVTETGTYFDLYSSHLFSGTYFVGKGKHKMLITAGITNFRRYDKVVYPSETIIGRAKDLQWNAGIGYQFTSKRMYFRTTAYFLALPNISIWAPDYLPWIGLTAGYKL
ncbi:MAG: hypothetical protein AB8B56_01090 [Crocinitomicaceae bacterium]